MWQGRSLLLSFQVGLWVVVCSSASSIPSAPASDDSDRATTGTWTLDSTATADSYPSRERLNQQSHKSPVSISLEKALLEIPSAESAMTNLRFLTSQPHVAGTLGDETMAQFVVQEFEQAGIPNVTIFDLEVYLNYPQMHRRPKLILKNLDAKVVYQAKLAEPILEEDPTSDTVWRNHPFHGYAASGQLYNASYVYANFGRPQDFEALEKADISINGTIVLTRYGKCFRGLKVQNAQIRGAIGVLIYSDPEQDGYAQHPGDQEGVYPDGPWRPPAGIQRGSVQFNSMCGGDPYRADPRYKSQQNATLQSICGVSSWRDLIPSIPSLPLSYEDAKPLLEHIGGPLAKDIADDFEGGIHGITYRVGPSNQTMTLDMEVYNTEPGRKTIPNVVGVIPGLLPPHQDMPVLLGNHRDAWVYGAADPNSGTAALLEVAKAFGSLYQDFGWKPMRTIYLLSWSGEEYGLLGSTGWGELNDLSRALVYLNVDTIVSGDRLNVQASPSLTTVWEGVIRDLNVTQNHEHHLYDVNSNSEWVEKDDEDIGILGSGSDYTVFLDHLGIPSIDFKFEKHSGTYGQYHSIYDSFAWMDKYGGAANKTGSAWYLMKKGARMWALLAFRLAHTELVQLDPMAQGKALAKYAKGLERQKMKLDVHPIHDAVKKFEQEAAQLELKCQQGLLQTVGDLINDCNEKFGLMERKWLMPGGLPKRPWFKHALQAPGMHLGYAAEAFPAVQQAIDDNDPELAQEEIHKLAKLIQEVTDFLKS